MISLGIDPSVTATGIVVLQQGYPEPVVAETVKVPKKIRGSSARYRFIADKMIDTLNDHHPSVVVIEGYGLSFKHKSSVVPLCELGGLLRYLLLQYDYPFFDPRPGQVKGFATGSGNAPKGAVLKAVAERWGFETKDDNLADAYACAMLGLAHQGGVRHLKTSEREIVGSLRLTTA